jgi:hypothetical protein
MAWQELPRAAALGYRQPMRKMSVMAASSEASVPRYVGAAFVAQFVTSLAAGFLSTSVLSALHRPDEAGA